MGLGEAYVDARDRRLAAGGSRSAVAVAERWPRSRPDYFGQSGIPEVRATELTSEIIGSALEHRGSLIVRGLLDMPAASSLLTTAKESFAARDECLARGLDRLNGDFAKFSPAGPVAFDDTDRLLVTQIGGLMAVEAPYALHQAVSMYCDVGLGSVVAGYLGEWPLLSAMKTTFRMSSGASPTQWHQDGAFLGASTRVVNVWTALTDCGVQAPGIDIFARPFDYIVPTGTDDALFSWSVGPSEAKKLGLHHVVRPEFGAGDALLFNQFSLHKSGVSPSMPDTRYALESWFFAPSTYPDGQIPMEF